MHIFLKLSHEKLRKKSDYQNDGFSGVEELLER